MSNDGAPRGALTREEKDELERLGAGWHPRARDVPHWRDELVKVWQPDGAFTRMVPVLAEVSGGKQQLIPPWERDTAEGAALWYVGTEMCDLLAAAAPDLPDTKLTIDAIPDHAGLVVFETPLAGLDADNPGNPLGPVHVGAMLWGPARWAWDGSPILGITIYGPYRDHPPWLIPLGALIWPIGRSCEDSLDDEQYHHDGLPDYTVASMAEDRRRLLALWLLSSQPGLTTAERRHVDRAAARREARTGRDTKVRIVQLRHGPAGGTEGTPPGARTRTYRHRWTVSGHWRQQPYGPGRGQRRPIYINPFLKGPEGAPLLTSPKVKTWTR